MVSRTGKHNCEIGDVKIWQNKSSDENKRKTGNENGGTELILTKKASCFSEKRKGRESYIETTQEIKKGTKNHNKQRWRQKRQPLQRRQNKLSILGVYWCAKRAKNA